MSSKSITQEEEQQSITQEEEQQSIMQEEDAGQLIWLLSLLD